MSERGADRVAAIRRFNRFYTRQIGLLNEGLLKSPLSLTQMRVLYELAQPGEKTPLALRRELGLDAGYLSRLLAGFEQEGLVARRPAPGDGRSFVVALTERGRAAFAPYDRASAAEVEALLAGLSEDDRGRLVGAMAAIERLLDPGSAGRSPVVLRPHRPGDMGWVVHRHGVLYAAEYGFDARFEALVAGIVADFVKNLQPGRERCWIADREGEILGSVFLVAQSETVGKLRLLYVEPAARGLGLGRRLVEECIAGARAAGYRTLELWTNDNLTAARHIYRKAGFEVVEASPHESFGRRLVGETWRLVV